MHDFTRYVNPHLGELLEQVAMDKVYVRGEGRYLYDAAGNRYLDFIAAYGALPFGYNPPEIWAALDQVREGAQPSFIQPAALEAAGELARRLVELAPPGLAYVTFANSGAETVEAALKMARSATGRKGILSTHNSFHGKTLGALSATGNDRYQEPFGAPVEGFKSIPYDDPQALEEELEANGSLYAAFILEAIQGEGGIVVPRAGYLSRAGELCRRHGVLFIVDEIQTGLGRTGRLFACDEENVSPDMLLLAKALGGGLYPIGACLSTAAAYTRDFGERHSSTFAANTLGSRIGLKVLDILTRNDQEAIKQVRKNGSRLREALELLQRRYPRVLKGVRGRGYMLGLEFEMSRSDFSNCLMSVLSEQDSLTPLVSSYLLNEQGLRVAPTLNGNKVIRLEPALTVTWEECLAAVSALEKVVAELDTGNTLEIIRPVLGLDTPVTKPPARVEPSAWERYQPSSDPGEGRFAFLQHPLDLYNYHQFDPSLKSLSLESLQKLADLGSRILEPFVVGRTTVVSHAGHRAYGEFIALPYTAREMVEMDTETITAELAKALRLALKRGARLVGLGAYTSVVSRGGTLLQGRFLPITTGNSYTVVAGAEAVKLAARRFSMNLARETAAVIGATGSIGRTLAILLAEEMQRIILVGNPRHPQASARRLRRVGAAICQHLAKQAAAGWTPAAGSLAARLLQTVLPAPDAPPDDWLPVASGLERDGVLAITTDIAHALPLARVVITATSSPDDLVNPMFVAKGAIICDISKPSNVRPTLRQIRPDVLVIDGGVVAVPGRPSLGWDFGFEQGLAYACMAETMMLALEHHYTDMSLGTDLSLDNLVYLRQLAAKHGFELAQLRSFDLPLDEEEWRQVDRARSRTDGLRRYGATT
ncbi:MAG: aminotransferase class III-fold pyridoxal phosphate-dependent enzyme [Peptococcaceae bacterium]|jgi:acetylornithine/succinyldiaminopimelate/putrescine aminotransferase/predicted amino acid dehydrogenase|nr:aminotransferase class III-fold pyridoxal phosphate-dependent enzyme [Peptococcaceae bacterium]